MSRPLDWLRQVPQIPLTASGLTIASVSQRCVYFLPFRTRADSHSSPWLDSLVIPAYCAILSGALLLFPAVGNALRKRKSPECFLESSAQAPPPPSFLRRRVESVGSVTIFLYRFLQLLSILALLVLSVLVPLRDATPHARVAGPFTVVDIVQTVLYVRAVSSAITCVYLRAFLNRSTSPHWPVSLRLAVLRSYSARLFMYRSSSRWYGACTCTAMSGPRRL